MHNNVKNVLSRRGFLAASAVGLSARPDTFAEAGSMLRQAPLACQALAKTSFMCVANLKPQRSAFLTVTGEQASARAKSKGHGPLRGMPTASKNLHATTGVSTAPGSEFFRNRASSENATVVAHRNKAGAVSLGKTSMNALATGLSGTNKFFGDAPTLRNQERSPGLFSGGAGVAAAYEKKAGYTSRKPPIRCAKEVK